MRKSYIPASLFFLAGLVFISGCATTRAKRDTTADLQGQVTELQSRLQAKDQEIQGLQARLESNDRAIQSAPTYAGQRPARKLAGSNISSSTLIRVSGVSVKDVQQALVRAGLEPGPVDGRMGKKTKAAVKEFQRSHHLRADGIVGEKTWSLLRQ